VNGSDFWNTLAVPHPLFREFKDFLDRGFREPCETLGYLRQRGFCRQCKSPCHDVFRRFSDKKSPSNLWGKNEAFFQWCHSTWCPPNKKGVRNYEWPICAVFFNSLIPRFLAHKGLVGENPRNSFRVEFTGKGRAEPLIPPCLWRKSTSEFTGIGRKYKGRTLYYDFFLQGPFPPTVGEVKVVNPKIGVKSNFSAFSGDLDKCEGWLIPETPFKYALAILIDLTGTKVYRDAWDYEITSKNWPQKDIFPWLIAPSSGS